MVLHYAQHMYFFIFLWIQNLIIRKIFFTMLELFESYLCGLWMIDYLLLAKVLACSSFGCYKISFANLMMMTSDVCLLSL